MMTIIKLSFLTTIMLNTIRSMHTHITTVPTIDMYWPTITLTQCGMILLKPITWEGGTGRGGLILGDKLPRIYVLSFPG